MWVKNAQLLFLLLQTVYNKHIQWEMLLYDTHLCSWLQLRSCVLLVRYHCAHWPSLRAAQPLLHGWLPESIRGGYGLVQTSCSGITVNRSLPSGSSLIVWISTGSVSSTSSSDLLRGHPYCEADQVTPSQFFRKKKNAEWPIHSKPTWQMHVCGR